MKVGSYDIYARDIKYSKGNKQGNGLYLSFLTRPCACGCGKDEKFDEILIKGNKR
jgi:hypothetical protein